MANETEFDTSGDLASRIENYREKFVGTQTEVESVEYPDPDKPWLEVLTWLIARADDGTIKRSEPSSSNVDTFVYDNSGSTDTIAVSRSDGTKDDVADTGATQTAQKLEVVDGDPAGLEADLGGRTAKLADEQATQTAKRLRIVEDTTDGTISLKAVTSDNAVVTIAGNSTTSSSGESLSDDTDVQNDALTFPTVPMIDKTVKNIEESYEIPIGGLAYSLKEDQLVVNKP
ncbi:hypothetical protein [Halorubrum sp. Atlit-26R]|uniref:hypothetical protein n=1 Tax=Halorubrum sp. Atlit-26R TaxID=2282128 RepID=UPI000EF2867B|nr:hypothetical protein [Halorubrum sp. Atlit-26R]RLM68603.1 hypothetical protein DVK07_10810 [Halorubrum sp. Atlit-26R]